MRLDNRRSERILHGVTMTNDEILNTAHAIAEKHSLFLIEQRLRELKAGVYGISNPDDNSRRILELAIILMRAESTEQNEAE